MAQCNLRIFSAILTIRMWIIAAVLVCDLLPTVTLAQPGLFGGNPRRDEDLFLLGPRSLQRLLNEGREMLDDNRYTEGIAGSAADRRK